MMGLDGLRIESAAWLGLAGCMDTIGDFGVICNVFIYTHGGSYFWMEGVEE